MKADFLLGTEPSSMLLFTVCVSRSDTRRFSLSLFACTATGLLTSQKCLKICLRLLVVTLVLRLWTNILICLGLVSNSILTVVLGLAHPIVPFMRPPTTRTICA